MFASICLSEELCAQEHAANPMTTTIQEKSRIKKGHVNRMGDGRFAELIVRQVIRALRCARAHRVESLAPSAFLQGAAETGAHLPALLRGYILWCIPCNSSQQSDAQSPFLELSGLLKAPTRAAFMEHDCICGSPFPQNAQLGNIIPLYGSQGHRSDNQAVAN